MKNGRTRWGVVLLGAFMAMANIMAAAYSGSFSGLAPIVWGAVAWFGFKGDLRKVSVFMGSWIVLGLGVVVLAWIYGGASGIASLILQQAGPEADHWTLVFSYLPSFALYLYSRSQLKSGDYESNTKDSPGYGGVVSSYAGAVASRSNDSKTASRKPKNFAAMADFVPHLWVIEADLLKISPGTAAEFRAEVVRQGAAAAESIASKLRSEAVFRSRAEEENSDWELACEYFPNIRVIYEEIRLSSEGVAEKFRISLLKDRSFDRAEVLARRFSEEAKVEQHEDWVRRYGDHPKVLALVRELHESGDDKALAELERAVRVLGPGVAVDKLIARFSAKIALSRAGL